jgi:hypothetical protein
MNRFDGPRMCGGGYRLAYNGFPTLHVALIWLGGRALVGANAMDLGLPEGVQTVLTGVRWVGLLVIVVALLPAAIVTRHFICSDPDR